MCIDFKNGDRILMNDGETTETYQVFFTKRFKQPYIKYKGEQVFLQTAKDIKLQRLKFYKWQNKNGMTQHHQLSEVVENPQTDFSVGDTVIYTNDNGVKFIFTILDFCEPTSWGASLYFDWESYWYPAKPQNCQKVIIDKID
jgi:hypothetical protein